MLVLGIETSGLEGSIAIVRDGRCLAERQLNQSGRRHAQSLVMEIGELLRMNELSPRDVDVVAVSRGPGSFTGLRVGMVCAKTFAYAAECRLIAVDTFAAIAENLPSEMSHVYVIEDAQRDDLFVGEYLRASSSLWEQVAPIQIVAVKEFVRHRSASDLVMGPGTRKLLSVSDVPILLAAHETIRPRAKVIAEMGNRLFLASSDGPPSSDRDYWRAVPFYLRASAAEEKRAGLEENKQTTRSD